MNRTPEDLKGWYDLVLMTDAFNENLIAQYPTYEQAKEVAQRIMGPEHDWRPFAVRIRLKPSTRQFCGPPLKVIPPLPPEL